MALPAAIFIPASKPATLIEPDVIASSQRARLPVRTMIAAQIEDELVDREIPAFVVAAGDADFVEAGEIVPGGVYSARADRQVGQARSKSEIAENINRFSGDSESEKPGGIDAAGVSAGGLQITMPRGLVSVT